MGELVRMLAELRRRFKFGRHREQWDREMEEEMAFHVDMRCKQYTERGVSEEEAYRAACIDFGNPEAIRERSRDAWLFPAIEGLVQDATITFRGLFRNPGWTALASGTLAVAIAACTAAFALTWSVLLRPLPYANDRELVLIFEERANAGFLRSDTSPGNYRQLKSDTSTFAGMAMFHGAAGTLSGGGNSERISGVRVTPEFFEVLGVKPALGRFFRQDDVGVRSLVISYDLWQRSFAGRPEVLGSRIQLSEESWTVVGVAAPDFQFLYPEAQFWTPVLFDTATWARRDLRYLNVVARLRPGVSTETAQAELDTLAPRFQELAPVANRDFRAVAVPLRLHLTGDVRSRMLLLSGFAALVLLIACANVAHLVLSRSVRRASELAIRLSLGASRSRLVRQLLTEAAVLSLVGGAAGFLLAMWSMRALQFLVPDSMAVFTRPQPGWHVVAIALAVTGISGIVSGLLPAFRAGSTNWNQAIRAGSPRLVGGFGHERLRGLLVISEVALAVVLAVGASLLLRSLTEVLHVDPGFRYERVLTAETSPPKAHWSQPQRTLYLDEALRRVRALPGVESASFLSAAPFTWKGGRLSFRVDGIASHPDQSAINRQATPGYFDTLQIPIRSGRAFNEGDRKGLPLVAIVNERMVRLWFEGRDPVGRQLRVLGPGFSSEPLQIVGVAADVREMGLLKESPPVIYVPAAQTQADFNIPFTLAVRTAGDPREIASALRGELAAGWPGMPVSKIRTLAEIVEREMADRRPMAFLGGALASLAVVLACVGVYGLLSFTVAQRVPEIGIRLALGAPAASVARIVVRGAAGLVACGIAAGLAAAALLTQLIRTVLYNVQPLDPSTFVVAPLVMVATVALACALPLRAALQIDPAIALRKD